jgi:acetoin utilization deacetylase AcuC-like enzyme
LATALITHADGLDHVTPAGHPERVARLEHLLHGLQELDLERISAPLAEDEALLRCHPQAYVDRITAAIPDTGHGRLDEDTWLSSGSLQAARRGVGAVLKAIDLVLAGHVANAFCAMRPPGHHAERETPMGFCLFGNIAIGAKYALDHHGLQRVAVVDFDVHHGNGTQDLLWSEPRSLFIGSHQSPLWPGSGSAQERGASDNILNLPLPPGSGGAEMRVAYGPALARLRAYQPELILISAGFDAHQDDPLANLNWTVDDFRWITDQLCDVARECCQGRVVSTLEGGYDLAALTASGRAHVEGLLEAGK